MGGAASPSSGEEGNEGRPRATEGAGWSRRSAPRAALLAVAERTGSAVEALERWIQAHEPAATGLELRARYPLLVLINSFTQVK